MNLGWGRNRPRVSANGRGVCIMSRKGFLRSVWVGASRQLVHGVPKTS